MMCIVVVICVFDLEMPNSACSISYFSSTKEGAFFANVLFYIFVQVTALKDIKASGNWMYAAKLDGEGAAMYDAAVALKEAMIELEVAIDGGKDSLSMAAQAGGETVKCPGNLVISAYVTCPDITKTVTPDLKVCY